MKKASVVDTLKPYIHEMVEAQGLEFVDLEFVKEYGNHVLRILVDKPGGLSLDDCQAASEVISDWLDVRDPISHSYLLEVSSPGLDRPIKTDSDLKRIGDEEVEIKLYVPLNGVKKINGRISCFDSESITIIQDSNKTLIKRADIALIKRVIKIGGR